MNVVDSINMKKFIKKIIFKLLFNKNEVEKKYLNDKADIDCGGILKIKF